MYGHERSLVEEFSGRPFVLLGVNNDQKISRMEKAVKDNNLNWRSWYDGQGGPIVKDYGIRSFPTIFLVDHNGVIRYKNLRGAVLNLALESLLTAAESEGMRGGSEPGPIFREFADVSGKFKTLAAYTRFDNGKVVLKKEDDAEVKVPWERLSVKDRHFVAIERLKNAGLKKKLAQDTLFPFDEPFEFTDSSGKKSILATFIAINDGKAILWKTDGNEVSIPWKKLSESSKEYIKQELKRLQ